MALNRYLPALPVVEHLEKRKANSWKRPWKVVITTYDIAREEYKEYVEFQSKQKFLAPRQGNGAMLTGHPIPYVATASTHWNRIIFDECHRLINDSRQSKKMAIALKSDTKILLAGT